MAVTVAPEMGEPDLSTTVPEKLPVACPHAVDAKHIPSAITNQARNTFFMFFSLRLHTPFSQATEALSETSGLRKHLQGRSLGRLTLKTQEERLWKLCHSPFTPG